MSKKIEPDRVPAYVPWPYKVFLSVRKAYRQSGARMAERQFRAKGNPMIEADGPAVWTPAAQPLGPNPTHTGNKGDWWLEADLARPELARIADAIEGVKTSLKDRNLRFTNTAATFLPRMFYPRSERSKLWENALAVHHSGLRDGERVLDIGGASTPFSFYLASRGCDVAVLDNDWANCGTIFNTDYVGARMGWKLKAHDADVAKPFPFASASFDRVFSICTIEHLPSSVRRAMMAEVGRVLKSGGVAAITFCYDMAHPVLSVDKGLRYGYWEKFLRDVVTPSGLEPLGPVDRTDYEGRDFLGAIFVQRPHEPDQARDFYAERSKKSPLTGR
jgi:SAM-dependent methyltransferase